MISIFEDNNDIASRLHFLGRRVEKTIYIGLILSLISFSYAGISLMNIKARVQESVTAINDLRVCLRQLQSIEIQKTQDTTPSSESADAVQECVQRVFLPEYDVAPTRLREYTAIEPLLDNLSDIPNEKLDGHLSNLINNLSTTSIKVGGLEIPQKIVLDLLGNKLSFNLPAGLGFLSLPYGMILLVWLLTFKRTRTIEILTIRNHAKDITYVYPHLLNSFPSRPIPDIGQVRGFNWLIGLLKRIPLAFDNSSRSRILATYTIIATALGPFITAVFLPLITNPYLSVALLAGQIAFFIVLAYDIEYRSIQPTEPV